jgi:XapX domain-containing protein
MIKLAAGIVLSMLIGAACRWFDVPTPSPPRLEGALLVIAMTLGYIVADKLIATKFVAKGPATTQQMCGGPTGKPASHG